MERTGSYFEEVTPADAAVTVADGDAAPLGEQPAFERGGRLDRYVVLETLGKGGMGVVLAAYDPKLDRRVALKLLRQRSNNPENHARMLREAQALAKLSHPGVVSVYDVGEVNGQVFIAMEFIDGPDLRRWLREEKRSTQAIVSVFRGAAMGLQAAHDVGIVHRDFKPDNVLIGSDGKPRVTDFGLALEAHTLIPVGPGPSSTPVDLRLTETGMVMGTPAYMSIEQHRGLPTDPRSDQFAFCVSFFEALYGIRPFSGTNGNEYCAAIERAELPLPATPVSVPRRVHRAIVRGLSAKPDERFPSMRALLRALSPPTRNRRTWLLGGLGGLALGATAVVLADPPEQPCSTFDARIADAYGTDDTRRILAAFTATGLPYAQSSFDATRRTLDGFAERWVESAEEACMAHERGEQSDRLFDLRMRRLERSLQRLEATTEALADANEASVEVAPQLAARLPPLDACSNIDQLAQRGFVPETAEQRADAEELLPLIDRALVLAWMDRDEEARALVDPLTDRLRTSTHPRVRASYADLLGRSSVGETSEQHFTNALRIALEHNLDDIASSASIRMAYLAKDTGRFGLARIEFERGAALARSVGDPVHLTDAYIGLAKLEEAQLNYGKALEHTQAALDALRPGMPELRASVLLLHSSLLMLRDGSNAGLEELERAHAILVRQVGEDNPAQEEYLQEVIKRSNARADPQRALEASEKLLALIRRNRGPGSSREAVTLANKATTHLALGQLEEALESNRQADVLLREAYGESYPDRPGLLNNRGDLLVHLGRLDEARTTLEEARTLFEAQLGPGTIATGVVRLNLSEVERLAGNLDTAREHATAALEIFQKQHGPEHVRVGRGHVTLAETELESGAPALAREHLEAALAIGTPKPPEAQLWTLLHAEATLRDPAATDEERHDVRTAVARERAAWIEGAPTSDHAAEVLARIDALTPGD